MKKITKIIDFDKMIKETNRAKWFSYTLATFFAGATCFAPYLLYGLIFGFAMLFWIIVGNLSDNRLMIWELKKEMNK